MVLISLLLAAAPPEPEGVVCHIPLPPDYVPPPEVATCDDRAPLEAKAVLGQLWRAERACLEEQLLRGADPAARRATSLLLVQNAEAKGDAAEWTQLMRRHLEEVDASDPTLCLSYALRLSRGGASRAEETIRWAEAALALEATWPADHDANVYAANKLRADSANRLWSAEERALSEGGGSAAEAKRARARAAELAREWLWVATATSQDPKAARALCRAAASSGGCE